MDPERIWFPQRTICHVSMDLAASNAKYDTKHSARPYHDGAFESWAKERSASHPYHYRDGVTIWMHDTDLNPEDQFL